MLDKKTLSERDICTKYITPAEEAFEGKGKVYEVEETVSPMVEED